MRTRTRAAATAGALLASVVTVLPVQAAEVAPAFRVDQRDLDWQECEDLLPVGEEALECATLVLPMDHGSGGNADAETVELALSRASAGGDSERTLLVNPGGPGSPGRDLASRTHQGLPEDLREIYAVVGFDPRGSGASVPAVECDPSAFEPVRAPSIPDPPGDTGALWEEAESYARACADNTGRLLDHMATVDTARDMEALRAALGLESVDYLGYSYGTYLGAVFSSLFPESVDRLVLDSVVDPDTPWHESNLAQSRAVERAADNFFDWIARHDDAFGLGGSAGEVERAYHRLREELRDEPLEGTVGPTELENLAITVAYTGRAWPVVGAALADRIVDEDPAALVALDTEMGEGPGDDQNRGGYNAVQCTDSHWPSDRGIWESEGHRAHDEAPFIGWNNIWYNAACASWSAESGEWYRLGDGPGHRPAYEGDALLVHAADDGATPLHGAENLRAHMPGASLTVEENGITHAVSLGDNPCVDGIVTAYLREGSLPERTDGEHDAVCEAPPEPEPRDAQSAPQDLPDRAGSLGGGHPGGGE
ncbi:alpha/beta fold hydrolase [Nocardiopsis xinjiangensis]|uniref:alpha/beta fold hydrolase n=1 Tax=Nocardiopsis xinjiangensis TaxID=124285 RepID=UPI00034CBFA2|nr:alpha/beta fold hydrolase [Nocardiopsis xinjiangensis]